MAVKTGFETNIPFTMWMDFHMSELDSLGEAELINETMSEFFATRTYEESGVTYSIGDILNMQTRMILDGSKATVVLYGVANLNGALVNA